MNELVWFDEPILAIESSCDETSAAVVTGCQVLSNIVSSQVPLHMKWGGIVPEVAARAHVEAILPVIEEALQAARFRIEDLRAVAVTNRPGLVGALSIGVSAGKALAFSLDVPLIGIHHLEGHLLSPFANGVEVPFPHISLIVSGGHTELVLVNALGSYKVVGRTIDDAAGEAFDKAARLFGLGYPGGTAIQHHGSTGNPKRYSLPRGLKGTTLDFSFSGLKTAVLRLVEREGPNLCLSDACASVEEAICSVLSERAMSAAALFDAQALTLVGGVAANHRLRTSLLKLAATEGRRLYASSLEYCTDNAAMIGLAASFRLAAGERSPWGLPTLPNAELPVPPD